MNVVLSTAGQQAIMDAQSGGYLLTLGYVRLYSTGTAEVDMPLLLNTASVDTNPHLTWTQHLGNISALDDFNPVTPDVLQVVATLPDDVGDFSFDAVGIFLSNNTLLGIGTYERPIEKVAPGIDKTSNIIELDFFIRHASISGVIDVTRQNIRRPYSIITEVSNADALGKASENNERIYRITRPTNALGNGDNNFTTFLAHAGTAFFDGQNKPYQKEVWCPSDHLSMFGNATLQAKIINSTSISVLVPKNTYPMIEHVIAEVPYLLATTAYGANPLPTAVVGGLLLESVFSTRIDTDPTNYEFIFQLTHSEFLDTGSHNQTFGVILYAANTDLAAQTAIKIALKKFLEFQYAIGRTYTSDDNTNPNDVLLPYLGYTTYWQKLDGIVLVATSTTDGRFASPGQLYDLPDYATGGEQLLAPVLRATNMWLRYDPASSGTITYQLGTDRTTVNEGGTINVTVLTTGLANGSLVGYTVTGIQQADLSSGSLTGFFTINNNIGTASFGIAADQLTEGTETFTISIDAEPSVTASVTINDTSITQSVQSFYAANPSATIASALTSVNEGQTFYYVTTVVGIVDGTYLYPRIESSGDADQYDFVQAVPNSVRVTGGRISFQLTASNDQLTEGLETLTIGLYNTAVIAPENRISLASLDINDTSVTPIVSSYFYTDTVSSNPPSVSQVNEGQYVYLNISTTGYAAGTVFALTYPTDVDRPVGSGDFSTARPTTVTLNSQGKATVAYFIANDSATEEYPGGIDTETFAVQIKANATDTVPLSTASVLIKDTSKLTSGSFTILDITDPLNPVPFFSSEDDQLSEVDNASASSGGLGNKYYNVGTTFPLDVCFMLGHKYRLVWIHSAAATSSVTRAVCDIYSSANYGVGIGNNDTDSATGGKALSMIDDGNGNTLGYGAIFEFTITKVNLVDNLPISMPFVINIYSYYPNGIPGFSTASDPATSKWALAKSSLINHKENNDTAKIKNLYHSTIADWTTFCSKEITVPFGAVADFFIVLPGGSGATSSLASSGSGNDGSLGHDFNINFPYYRGLDGMLENVSVIAPTPSELMFPLLNALGGDSGKGQLFSGSATNLGGTGRSTITVNSAGMTTLATLLASSTKGLFGKAANRILDFDVICEIVQVIEDKDWQLGKSTEDDHSGGLGVLPLGLSDVSTNYRGGGGKGGDSVGTGTGYGGGGSSGAIVHIRLGTKVNTAGFTSNPSIAPVSFILSDETTIAEVELAGTDPLPTGKKSFEKATTTVLSGANNGADGSEFYISQLSYEEDAKTLLDRETLVGAGTPRCFVRPTHNATTFPTLAIRDPLDWDYQQLNQVTVPKLGIRRVVINATGVEGQYVDGASATVDGTGSDATNALTFRTVSPDTTANETVGSTFVYFAGVAANTDGGAPTLNTGKLSVYQNLMVSNYRSSNGTDAVTNGDNEYSRGGFIDMYVTNYNTKSGTLFVELPRVNLSLDNPARISDTANYLPDTWWSDTSDSDGNAISSHNYMLADGDGALSVQLYTLATLVRLRPWIPYGMKDINPTDKNAPIILQQGEAVTLTVVGGGGAQSTRAPDGGVTTPDPAFNGSNLVLQVKGLANDTYTTFLTCLGGEGSIDNSTNPTAADVPTYNATPLTGILKVLGTPTLLNGVDNPIKVTHGGTGSGSYAQITLLNQNATPVTIRATGGRGGSGESTLQVSDGVILVTVI